MTRPTLSLTKGLKAKSPLALTFRKGLRLPCRASILNSLHPCRARFLAFRISDFFRTSAFGFRILSISIVLATLDTLAADSPGALFRQGVEAYRSGEYTVAAKAFRQSAFDLPASGTYQNLGLAEWHRGRVGPAILAWEQGLWVDTFNTAARSSLQYARKTAQLESPTLTWYEVVSTWLPLNWWTWIAGGSFWIAVGVATLPALFRRRKAGWHQAVAALGLMLFLLSLPALFGVHTRCKIGFVLQRETPLQLTPTREGQVITLLSSGEPARVERARGEYLLIKTSRGHGWIPKELFARLSP